MSAPAAVADDILDLDREDEIERIIARRVAERAQIDAWRWRLRLVVIDTLMLAALVAAAGLALGRPTLIVVRATAIVGGSCFASGMLLIGLSATAAKIWSGLRKRLARRWQ
jgi:hypothetical protein